MADALVMLRQMITKLPDATIREVDAGIEQIRLVNGSPKNALNWPRRQALASTFFDLGPTMLSIVDQEHGIWVINATWGRVLGRTFEEMDGKLLTFIHPEDQTKTTTAIESIYENGVLDHFVNRYQHAEGHYVAIQWESRLVQGCIYSSGVPLP